MLKHLFCQTQIVNRNHHLGLDFVSRQPNPWPKALWHDLICSQGDGSLIIEGLFTKPKTKVMVP